ncbi:MAG: hypothetical protein WED00_04765 [Aquisalimonadaceae bacterium]
MAYHFRILLLLALTLGAIGHAHGYGRDLGTYPDAAYLGVAAVNDLAGAHIEVANPIGSIWILVGKHLDAPGNAQFETGGDTGFAAGLRFFSGGRGLTSSWYGALLGGTLDVDTRRESGNRNAYQRLGFGATLGYQFVSRNLRAGLGLGAAYLEPYTAAGDVQVDREYVPLVEGTVGVRF